MRAFDSANLDSQIHESLLPSRAKKEHQQPINTRDTHGVKRA